MYEKYFLDLLSEKGLSAKMLWEFEYVVLLSREHPLAEKDNLSLDDLHSYMEIVHGDLVVPTLSESDIKKDWKEEDTPKHILVYERGSQFNLLYEVPTTYMWVSPLPEELLERYGLVQRKCHFTKYTNKDMLIYPKYYQLSELEEGFLSALNQVKVEIVEINDKIH